MKIKDRKPPISTQDHLQLCDYAERELLEKKLPVIYEHIDSNLNLVSSLLEDFEAYRKKYYTDNNLKALEDAAG